MFDTYKHVYSEFKDIDANEPSYKPQIVMVDEGKKEASWKYHHKVADREEDPNSVFPITEMTEVEA